MAWGGVVGQGKKRGIGVVFMYFLWGGGREVMGLNIKRKTD
jgi:hypothetical protein